MNDLIHEKIVELEVLITEDALYKSRDISEINLFANNQINSFSEDCESLFEESDQKSTLDKNFKKKSNSSIKSKAIDIFSNAAKVYIDNDSYLRNLRDKKKLKDYVGEIIADEENQKVIGRFLVGTGKDSGFIGALRVYDAYKGMGFGDQLIEDAIHKYNGIDLICLKDNEIAYRMYLKHGFVVIGYGSNKDEYWMKLQSKIDK